ncbi:hypothetical protein LTR28_008754, partial [Elasticomyces elasticus]
MQLLKALICGATALASFAAAQSTTLGFSQVPTSVVAGQSYTVTYYAADTTHPVTIILRKGDPANLQTIEVLTSNSLGGSYTWIPSKSYVDAKDYALQITQGLEINYSGQITLTGGSASAISSAMAASSSSAAVAASITSA